MSMVGVNNLTNTQFKKYLLFINKWKIPVLFKQNLMDILECSEK